MDYSLIGWIVVFFLIVFIEGISQQLIAIWFAVGAIVAMIAELCATSFEVQFTLFIAASILALLALRPLTRNMLKDKIQATNSDENIGKSAVVIADFDMLTKEGRVQLEGIDWAARSIDDTLPLKGEVVTVKAIEGVKVLVTHS